MIITYLKSFGISSPYGVVESQWPEIFSGGKMFFGVGPDAGVHTSRVSKLHLQLFGAV